MTAADRRAMLPPRSPQLCVFPLRARMKTPCFAHRTYRSTVHVDVMDALIEKYSGVATRIVLYNALADAERLRGYGAVAQRISGA